VLRLGSQQACCSGDIVASEALRKRHSLFRILMFKLGVGPKKLVSLFLYITLLIDAAYESSRRLSQNPFLLTELALTISRVHFGVDHSTSMCIFAWRKAHAAWI